MEITVEVTQGLERKMTVVVPDAGIDQQVDKRLRSIAKTARMEGFRPGKVPLKIINKRYKDQVTDEVMGDMIQSTFGQALSKEEIQPASGPTLQSRELKDGDAFEYCVTFEVYPEFEVSGLDKIEVEKPSVTVEEADIDRMIETLREQQATWEEVERASQKDDRIVVDFEGKIDGEAFDGGETKDMPIVIGTGRMLEDFENNLTGLNAGDEKTFSIKFPDDYHGEAVAGKDAEFTVNVKSVSGPVLPEVDDEFVKLFGVTEGGVEKLRSDVKDNMQRELDSAVRAQVKNAIMDGLMENNKIDVPNAMVDEEVARLRKSMEEEMKRGGQTQLPDMPASVFEDQARKRVVLGLLVAEVVKSNEIKPDPAKVDEEIKTIASTYEQSEAVEQAYRERADLRQSIEALVVENQVVDVLMGQVKVKEVNKNFYDVVQSRV